ncbi:hypothetical protein EV1_030552 [Malus domestica]
MFIPTCSHSGSSILSSLFVKISNSTATNGYCELLGMYPGRFSTRRPRLPPITSVRLNMDPFGPRKNARPSALGILFWESMTNLKCVGKSASFPVVDSRRRKGWW